MLFVVGIALIGAIFPWEFMSFIMGFKHRVIIVEERGGSKRIFLDFLKIKKSKDGHIIYRLLRKKDKVGDLPLEYLYNGEKGKDALVLYSPAEGQYLPMSIDKKNEKVKIIDTDMADWYLNTLEEASKKYEPENKSNLAKYLPMIEVTTVGIVIAIMAYVAFMGLSDIPNANPVLGQLRDAIDGNTEVIRQLIAQGAHQVG